MKKFLLSILCLFCVAGISAQTNIASNPGFENWEDEVAVDWAGPIGHNATVSQSTDAHTGNYSVAVAGNKNKNVRLASKSYTLAAGTYTFSVYVKANGTEAGQCRLGYVTVVDGEAGTYTYESASASATTAEWTERVYEFTLAEETEIALIVMNNKNGGGASFLVDDVTLTNGEATEGGNENEGEGEGETEVTYTTIAEVLAAGAGNAATKGTVVATYARGFLMSDETGSILVYLGNDKGYAAGDAVTVSGTTSVYGGILQFGNASVVEKTGTATVKHPTATVMDGAAMDAYLTTPVVKYVEYTGTLTITDKGYYNVAIEGATTAVGSIQYPQDAIKANLTSGSVVKVTGYTIGVSSNKYVNTMAVMVEVIEEGEEPEEPETPTETQEYTVTEALAAYVDGKQIPAIVTGYIVGAVNNAPETGSQFGAEATITTNILISDNPDTNDYTECLIVQLPSGSIRSALNLVDNPGNYKKQVKITGSVEKYFKVAGMKSVTAYEFTGATGIEKVEIRNEKSEIYDLTGRRIETITVPGIYIVDGKKVLVK